MAWCTQSCEIDAPRSRFLKIKSYSAAANTGSPQTKLTKGAQPTAESDARQIKWRGSQQQPTSCFLQNRSAAILPPRTTPPPTPTTNKHDFPTPRALPQLPRLPVRLPGRVAAVLPAPPRAAAPLRLLLHRRHRGTGPRSCQLLLRRPRPPPRGQRAGNQGRVPPPGARRPPGRRPAPHIVRRGLHPRPRGLLHALRSRQARRLRPPPPPFRRHSTAHRRSRTLALVPSAPFPPDMGD